MACGRGVCSFQGTMRPINSLWGTVALQIHNHKGKKPCNSVSYLETYLLVKLLIPLTLKKWRGSLYQSSQKLRKDNSSVNFWPVL